MLVVLALAALAILAAVVVLAMGRGGELAQVHSDHPPLQMPTGRRLTGTDVALLHLPHGLWGYQVDVTDEALHRLAYALSERDARVADLEARLAALHREPRTQDAPPPGDENGGRQPIWDDSQATPWDDRYERPVPPDPGHDDPVAADPEAGERPGAHAEAWDDDDDLVGPHSGDQPGVSGKEAG